MRITKYKTLLTCDDRIPALVKENSWNYTAESYMNNPEKIAQMFRVIFDIHRRTEEHVYILALNTRGKAIGVFEISHGVVDGSFCGSREIYMRAILCGATHIVIVHNHPSGDAFPSSTDKATIAKLKKAGEILGIKISDSIIIGSDTYYSFCENSLM